MRPIRQLLIGAMLLAFSTVYSQKEMVQAYLPSNAKTVININFLSMATKLNWKDMQDLDLFKQALADAPPGMQHLLKNPMQSGINFLNDLYIVMTPATDAKAKPNAFIYGTLADSAKFRNMLQNIDNKAKARAVGKMTLFAGEKNSAAWSGNVFVMQLSKGKAATSATGTAKVTPEQKIKQLTSQYQALLKPAVNPLSKDQRFTSLMQESGDIRFWINKNTDNKSSKPAKKNKADEMLKMLNLGMMQSGNYVAGVVRFENGKAVASMKSYVNDKLDSLYRLYPTKNLNTTLFRKLPSGQPLFLFTFSMSTDMIAGLFKETGMQKIMDSMAKKPGTRPLEIIESLNGDISIAVIKASEVDEKDSTTQALQGLQVIAAASVKNKSKLEPLIAQLQKPKEKKAEEEAGEGKGGGPFKGMKPAFLLNDSFFVFSISSFAAEKFMRSNAENETSRFISSYASHSSFLSLDLKTILGFAMQMSKKKPSGNDEQTAKLLDSFDKLVFYGGEYKDGAALGVAELQFSNKEENSLKQFVKLIEMGIGMGMKNKKSTSPPTEEPATEEKEQ